MKTEKNKISTHKRIFEKLKFLKEKYNFEILDFSEAEYDYRYAYILFYSQDNGHEIRKDINRIMAKSDNLMVYIISNHYKSVFLNRLKLGVEIE